MYKISENTFEQKYCSMLKQTLKSESKTICNKIKTKDTITYVKSEYFEEKGIEFIIICRRKL